MARGTGSEKTFRLERDLEAACCRLSKTKGWFCRKYKGPGRRAHPDRMFAKSGRVFWVEFKLPGNGLTALQQLELLAMSAAGLSVWKCDNYAHFEEILAAHERSGYLKENPDLLRKAADYLEKIRATDR